MGPRLFSLLERVHGHLGWLSVILLLHPVLTLRWRRHLTRWTVRSAEAAAALLTASFGLGWFIYPAYRQGVKPALLRNERAVAMAFESKEHLAVVALCLAVGGALTLRTAGGNPRGKRLAWWLLLGAAAAAMLTGGLGVFVASIAQPGW